LEDDQLTKHLPSILQRLKQILDDKAEALAIENSHKVETAIM
jgi:hypothetical protein